jgi:aspartyl-tRNA(Asn)/glutamyl-tRNA(Gln) amidotransferase subunit B
MSADQQYEAVIGLEIHVQLATESKMFCRCPNDSEGAAPNAHTCPVCLGLPGALPVPNRTAVEWSLKTALALGCSVPEESKFDRKQYFYPDLPKGYQISQYDQPFGGPGTFEFDLITEEGTVEPKQIRITRLHLEEDAGKLTHPKGASHSLVDLNRAGTPLMEIVTEPDFRSPAEAKAFLQELRKLVRYLGVSTADMEKGHLRADANVSVRPVGQQKYGTKTELKNLNSFKFVEKGLASEIERQTAIVAEGGTIIQETRGFVESSGQTVSQRSKEEANDYRYFPDPDLPPLEPGTLGLEALQKEIGELPVATRRKLIAQGISPQDAELLTRDRSTTEYFAEAAQAADPLAVAKLMVGPLAALKNAGDITPVNAAAVATLAAEGTVRSTQLKSFLERVAGGDDPATLVDDPEFAAADDSAVEAAVEAAITENAAAAEDFKSGNENSINVLMGAVMKMTKGSANPTTVRDLLRKKLS